LKTEGFKKKGKKYKRKTASCRAGEKKMARRIRQTKARIYQKNAHHDPVPRQQAKYCVLVFGPANLATPREASGNTVQGGSLGEK